MIRPGTLVAAAWAALALAAAGAAVAPGWARASSVTTPSSERVAFDDTTQHFTVPAGVHQVHLTGWGGGGGSGGTNPACTRRPAVWARTSISTHR